MSRPIELRVEGMDCAEEVEVLRRELGPLAGGEQNLSFDLLKGILRIAAPPGLTDEAVVAAVAKTGMRAHAVGEAVATGPERFLRAGLTVASGALAAAGFGVHSLLGGGVTAAIGSEGLGGAHAVPAAAKVLYAGAVAAGFWLVLPKAAAAVRRLRPDMNLLMAVAVVGAVLIGEWFESASVSFLFALSLLLESWSLERARRAIESLLDLAPSVVHVRAAEGNVRDLTADEVPIGARFLVKPGERIPLDGRVISGRSAVNQAPITGESAPVEKAAGAEVFAGTINGDGSLEVESARPASDTMLARIIHMVEQAQERRSPSQQWVDGFARVYTPAVFALSLAVILGPPLLLGRPWIEWIYRGLVLLVIGCPCALVISTPVSVVAAISAAARHGVLIKGGAHLETPARIKAFAFDKTGTLTEGRPVVREIRGLNGHTDGELLALAAAMEAHSAHPLACAVVAEAKARGVAVPRAEEFSVMPGKGAAATVGGRQYWLGSHRYLEERHEETARVHEELEALTRTGRTVVIVSDGEHVCGFIALADAVRPGAREALAALRRQGVECLVMLTGDNRGTAEEIARETGVDETRAELLPDDKARIVEELGKRYGAVSMVGDGINDAPALARSALGVAMGAAGSDAAIETADVALMSDDLGKLPWLVAHSRRSLAVIRQNIALSLSVKALFAVLTFAGVATLWSAIAADMGVSLLVIVNALRLLRTNG